MLTSYENPFGLEVKAPWACKTSENVYLGARANPCHNQRLLTFKTQLDGGFYMLSPSHLEGMNCRLETMQGKDCFYTKHCLAWGLTIALGVITINIEQQQPDSPKLNSASYYVHSTYYISASQSSIAGSHLAEPAAKITSNASYTYCHSNPSFWFQGAKS